MDPRRHALARRAHLHAQIKVGSDVAFLNGIMHVLISEDLYDRQFVEEHCVDFDDLKSKVMEYPPERASEISGVPADLIRVIAHTLASIKPAMVCYTLGITEHTCGKNNVMSIANLQMLLGNMGMESAGVNSLRGQNNVQGACDMGALPGTFPGYQSVTNPEIRAKFAQAWGVENLPDKPGLMIPDMMAGLPTGAGAVLIFRENLQPRSRTSPRRARACFSEFIVAMTSPEKTTTRFAHVILPAAAWCEDDGTFTSSERRVNRVRKIKEAPGLAKPNWWIFREIARRMGHAWQSNSAQEIWDDEVSVLVPAYGGIKYARLEQDGLQWLTQPCPTGN